MILLSNQFMNIKGSRMKRNRIKIVLILYILLDIVHYFSFRMSPNYSAFTEAFYETCFTSIIKWILCLVALILMYLPHKKLFSYLLAIIAILMIYFSITRGSLNYILLWYSSISLWILGFIGVFFLYFSSKMLYYRNH